MAKGKELKKKVGDLFIKFSEKHGFLTGLYIPFGELIWVEARREVINYFKERKRNAKNLYKMDNVAVSPKIVLNMLTKIINDAESKFLKKEKELES